MTPKICRPFVRVASTTLILAPTYYGKWITECEASACLVKNHCYKNKPTEMQEVEEARYIPHDCKHP